MLCAGHIKKSPIQKKGKVLFFNVYQKVKDILEGNAGDINIRELVRNSCGFFSGENKLLPPRSNPYCRLYIAMFPKKQQILINL
jgi:hypothetical protein